MPVRRELALHALAHQRQRAREVDHRVELLLVAPLAPPVVVAVLLAPAGVDAGRLDVAHRVRADPDVLPGGRDDELGDPRQDLGVGRPGCRPRPGTRSPCRAGGGGSRGRAVDSSQACHGLDRARRAAVNLRLRRQARRAPARWPAAVPRAATIMRAHVQVERRRAGRRPRRPGTAPRRPPRARSAARRRRRPSARCAATAARRSGRRPTQHSAERDRPDQPQPVRGRRGERVGVRARSAAGRPTRCPGPRRAPRPRQRRQRARRPGRRPRRARPTTPRRVPKSCTKPYLTSAIVSPSATAIDRQ